MAGKQGGRVMYGISYCEPRWDAWKDSYDDWKVRSPYDDCDEEPEFECIECEDTGWEIDEICQVAPCRLCHQECDLGDAYERTDIEFVAEDAINVE